MPADVDIFRISQSLGCNASVGYLSGSEFPAVKWYGRTVHITKNGETVLLCARTDAVRMDADNFRRCIEAGLNLIGANE
jgi:hypothetical protein